MKSDIVAFKKQLKNSGTKGLVLDELLAELLSYEYNQAGLGHVECVVLMSRVES